MALSQRDTQHVMQRLRNGTVPARGLEAFAVGIDRERDEISRLLDYVSRDEGEVKFLRGGYGCGKTFMARYATLMANRRRFVTAFTVVSSNDFHFYKFREVYSKVIASLSTEMCPSGALNDILDRWIGRIEEMLIDLGHDPEADDFDDKVSQRFADELETGTAGKVPSDFVRVVDAIFKAKQSGDFATASTLISWLSGSETASVDRKIKAAAGIKGDVTDAIALDFLRGILSIIRQAGYEGLLIVVDEAETIMRTPSNIREKTLNGIRQIVDGVGTYPGLLWLFTGTPTFFDSKRGVGGLAPLSDRLQFMKVNGYASARQPQLELKPFDRARLLELGMKIREIYPAKNRTAFEADITREYIAALVEETSRGFKGDVGVVPRQFLRKLVHDMDLVESGADYNPTAELGFDPEDVTLAEEEALSGESSFVEDADEAPMAVVDVW